MAMILAKYSAGWVDDFNNIANILSTALQGIDFTIEHIGSTSVPHLDSKPIIDIDIIFQDRGDFECIKLSLEGLGYYHNGDQEIIDREVFKRNDKLFNPTLDSIAHHLYVCPADSEEYKRYKEFRDFLRKNDWARKESIKG